MIKQHLYLNLILYIKKQNIKNKKVKLNRKYLLINKYKYYKNNTINFFSN